MKATTTFFGTAAILAAGLGIHIVRLGMLEIRINHLGVSTQSLPSCLFICSVLGFLWKAAPKVEGRLSLSTIVLYCLKAAIILGLTDLAFRVIWLPASAIANRICVYMGKYISVPNNDLTANYVPFLTKFVGTYAVFGIRFIFSFFAFTAMLEFIGFIDWIKNLFYKAPQQQHTSQHSIQEFGVERPMSAFSMIFDAIQDEPDLLSADDLPQAFGTPLSQFTEISNQSIKSAQSSIHRTATKPKRGASRTRWSL